MVDVIVIRSDGELWQALAAVRPRDGRWEAIAIPDAARRALGLRDGTALGAVVSTYIRETQENLDRVLRRTEEVDALLLFDESDALFGHRTGIRSAHDRYAGQETALLLERFTLPELAALRTATRARLRGRRRRPRLRWTAR